jgi:aminotransferase
MAKQYDDVIDFTLGDPDVPTPLGIKEAGCRAIMENKTRYSQNAGLIDLRRAISKYNRYYEGVDYNPENEIIVSVGAMEGLYLALLTLIDKGDEVIIPAPYYVNYKQMVTMCGGIPVIVEDEKSVLRCSIEALKDAITPQTKAIILNTPCNPTGVVLDDDYIKEVSKIAIENDLYVITDEVYKCLVYDTVSRPKSIASYEGMKERTIFINSMSKEFCMTGWRLGYVLSNSDVITAMTRLQENVVACAPLPSQYAAIEALRVDVNYSAEMAHIFKKRRDILVEEFSKTRILKCIPPKATFYAMIDISGTGLTSEDFAYKLLEKEHVAVVPGIAYGKMCDKYVRMAFTIEENLIIEGVRRILHFVEDYS